MEDPYNHIDTTLIYAITSVPGVGCPELFHEEFLEGCACDNTGGCSEASTCSCIKGAESFYDENSIAKSLSHIYPVFECNPRCLCSKNLCKNSTIQKGPIGGLCIKNTSNKGLGLFNQNEITKGTFICTYSGEIIGIEEGQKRCKKQQEEKKTNYILFVKEVFPDGPLTTVIDPTVIGNIGRYCNHSCNPNLIMVPIRIETLIPHLALFALNNIEAGVELTFDYGNPSTALQVAHDISDEESLTKKEKENLVKCFCGEGSDCKKYLPYHK